MNAAGAWADELAAKAGVPTIGLQPLRRTAAIASGAMEIDPAWPMVGDAADRYYFRPESRHLLISPSDETPSEPCDAKPDELDVALAMDRINAHTDLGLRRVHTAWAGLRSFVAGRHAGRRGVGRTTRGSRSSRDRAATASRWPRRSRHSAPLWCSARHFPPM